MKVGERHCRAPDKEQTPGHAAVGDGLGRSAQQRRDGYGVQEDAVMANLDRARSGPNYFFSEVDRCRPKLGVLPELPDVRHIIIHDFDRIQPMSTNFRQVRPVLTNFLRFDQRSPISTTFERFRPNFAGLGQISADFDQSWQTSTNFGWFSDEFSKIWPISDKFVRSWPVSIKIGWFRPNLADLDKLADFGQH